MPRPAGSASHGQLTNATLAARFGACRCTARIKKAPGVPGLSKELTTDVTREDQVVQLFKKTYETYGRVDILVNNAGVPTHVPIEDITLKYWQEVLDVNLTAAFLP